LEALFLELRALVALGHIARLREVLPEVRAMTPEPEWDAGTVLARVAAELRAHGHVDEADRVLAACLEWYRGRPEDERSAQGHGLGYADALLMSGNLSEARTLLERLRENHPRDRSVLGRLGVLFARSGMPSQLHEVMTSLEGTRGPYGFGAVDYWRAVVAAWSGEEEEAMSRLRQATAAGYRRGTALHADPFLEPLWSLPAFSLLVSQEP